MENQTHYEQIIEGLNRLGWLRDHTTRQRVGKARQTYRRILNTYEAFSLAERTTSEGRFPELATLNVWDYPGIVKQMAFKLEEETCSLYDV